MALINEFYARTRNLSRTTSGPLRLGPSVTLTQVLLVVEYIIVSLERI